MANDKKSGRLEVIKMIVSSQELATQEELLAELDIAGFPTSQATLVRDLRQLRIVKGLNRNGHYVYLMPAEQRFRTVSDTHVSLNAMHRLGALNMKFTGNIAVIKTLPGHAAHIAYDIDNANIPEILGTIAGDDTVFVAVSEGAERSIVMNKLSVFTQ